MELEKPNSEVEENACGEATLEPPPSTSSSAVEEEIPTVDRGEEGVEKGGPPLLDPSSSSMDGRLCSQDLAGATASPAENPRSAPIVTVPVVSVPCILAPASLAQSHVPQGFVVGGPDLFSLYLYSFSPLLLNSLGFMVTLLPDG